VSNERNRFYDLLRKGLTSLEIDLDAEAVDRLYLYFVELKKWSRKVNLIAKSTADEQIIENHFLDSLTLLPLLQGDKVHLLDVGTGAGFPGLVLKAVNPDMQLTLVEPRLKRVSFLKHIVRTLGLSGVEVLDCRIEDEDRLPSATGFTHITSRAVTEIGGFLEMIVRFSCPGLQVICMKGPKWQEELNRASDIVRDLRFVQYCVVVKALPFSCAERVLLVFLTHCGL
jgi:16S rRNA (guanine527-N7)-methyltransferase